MTPNHSRPSQARTLYITDLDGTLLNERSVVSPRSKALLTLLVGRGAMFTVATARTQATVTRLMAGIPAPLPYILMNGAAMWDAAAGRYATVKPLVEETVRQVCQAYERRGIHPFVYRYNSGVIDAYHHSDTTPTERAFIAERTGTPYKRFILTPSPYQASPARAMTIFSTSDYDSLLQVRDDIALARIPCHTVCYRDIFNIRDGILEVYAPGVTKAAAVEALKRSTGCGRLVVFGDNLNDLEMMLAADHSVAVGNAVEQLKSMASEVIGPNTADSVAKWIENDISRHES